MGGPPWHVDADLKEVLGYLGTAAALSLFLSPAKTFVRIVKNGSTEEFSLFPYVATLTQCGVWCVYALPFVTAGRTQPLITNIAGFGLELIYVLIFITYAVDRKNALLQTLGMLLFFGVIAVITIFLDGAERTEVLGIIADCLNVIMIGAPLSVLNVVLETKSVEYLPLPLLLCGFVNSAFWLGYATYVMDFYIMIPNALGVLLSIAQLALYMTYCGKKPPTPIYDRLLDDTP